MDTKEFVRELETYYLEYLEWMEQKMTSKEEYTKERWRLKKRHAERK